MEVIILTVHVIIAAAIIGLVMIQHGKGADMGASFGAGGSQTVFGGAGSANALTKATQWLALAFFITSIVLAMYAKNEARSLGKLNIPAAETVSASELPPITVDSDVPVVLEGDVPAAPIEVVE